MIGGSGKDPRLIADAVQQVRAGRNTPAEEHLAALVVADRSKDAAEAGALLAALGLLTPARAGAWRPQDRVRGWARPRSTSPTLPDCGSVRGAQAHHRSGEALCDLCQAWADERHRKTRTPPGSRCGSATGAQMHRGLGEAICEECRVAENAASNSRYIPTGNPVGRPRKSLESIS